MKLFCWLITAVICSGSLWATDYYVDAASGSDANPGTGAARAWRSLEKVNATTFQAGDRILFRSGGVWKGQLWPKGSGAAGKPIVVDRFGGEKKPRIDGAGLAEDAVRLHNQEYWTISNLEVTNQGPEPAVRRGVHLVLDDFGTAHDVVISGLDIHDVNGDLKRKDNGGIIWSIDGKKTPSRFDGLTIEKCTIERVDRSGMMARAYSADRRYWFPSLRVVIRDNYVNESGGDAIVPWATDGVLVEYNVARRANWRSDQYNAGIWPWSADNSVFRFNEAYLTKGLKDGQGFDSDYNSKNTLFEYNYSHDNQGGFMLICNDGGQSDPERNIGTTGTMVRHNLSQDDQTITFTFSGPVKNTVIHNNTVLVRAGLTVDVVHMRDWKGWAEDTRIERNVFAVKGTGRYGHAVRAYPDGSHDTEPGMGPARNTVFAGNVFEGNHKDKPQDIGAAGPTGLTGTPLDEFRKAVQDIESPEDRHAAWMKWVREMRNAAGGLPLLLRRP